MRLMLLVPILLLGACQTPLLNTGDMPKSLHQRLEQFEAVVRWGALQKMYIFGKHTPGEPVDIPTDLDNVRITGYQVASGPGKVEPMRWQQSVVIDYVLTDRQVVRQVVDQQVWVSEDEGKTWYRETPPPQFR